MSKHVCDLCGKKIVSDEAYEIHQLTHAVDRLVDALNYYISLKEEHRV